MGKLVVRRRFREVLGQEGYDFGLILERKTAPWVSVWTRLLVLLYSFLVTNFNFVTVGQLLNTNYATVAPGD